MPYPLAFIVQDWLVLGHMPESVRWGERGDRVQDWPVRPYLESIASADSDHWAEPPAADLLDAVEQITGKRTANYPEAASALLDSLSPG